jgi:hypothetical protein
VAVTTVAVALATFGAKVSVMWVVACSTVCEISLLLPTKLPSPEYTAVTEYGDAAADSVAADTLQEAVPLRLSARALVPPAQATALESLPTIVNVTVPVAFVKGAVGILNGATVATNFTA